MADAQPRQTQKMFQGRVFSVTRDRIELPSGDLTVRDVVRHGGSVAVVPIVGLDKVLLVKQYRFPVGEHIWEIPAGTIETGESPEQCVLRELEEETGYEATSLVAASRFYTTPGFCDETMYLYLAIGCKPSGTCSLDEDEDIVDRELFDIDQALDMVARGEIRDAKTMVGLMMAARTVCHSQ